MAPNVQAGKTGKEPVLMCLVVLPKIDEIAGQLTRRPGAAGARSHSGNVPLPLLPPGPPGYLLRQDQRRLGIKDRGHLFWRRGPDESVQTGPLTR